MRLGSPRTAHLRWQIGECLQAPGAGVDLEERLALGVPLLRALDSQRPPQSCAAPGDLCGGRAMEGGGGRFGSGDPAGGGAAGAAPAIPPRSPQRPVRAMVRLTSPERQRACLARLDRPRLTRGSRAQPRSFTEECSFSKLLMLGGANCTSVNLVPIGRGGGASAPALVHGSPEGLPQGSLMSLEGRVEISECDLASTTRAAPLAPPDPAWQLLQGCCWISQAGCQTEPATPLWTMPANFCVCFSSNKDC